MIVTKSQAAIMTIDTQMKGKINDIIKVVRIIKMTTRETFKGNQPVLTPMTIYRKKARNSYQSKQLHRNMGGVMAAPTEREAEAEVQIIGKIERNGEN